MMTRDLSHRLVLYHPKQDEKVPGGKRAPETRFNNEHSHFQQISSGKSPPQVEL